VIHHVQEKEIRSKKENHNHNQIQVKEGQEIIPALLYMDLAKRQRKTS